MNNLILYILLAFLLGCLVSLPLRSASKELLDLNSKIDKIVIFLDINPEDEVEGWAQCMLEKAFLLE